MAEEPKKPETKKVVETLLAVALYVVSRTGSNPLSVDAAFNDAEHFVAGAERRAPGITKVITEEM